MLNEFLGKLDFHDDDVRRILFDGQPSKWDGLFEGLQPLLYTGLRSENCLSPTLDTLDKLLRLPNDPLIGDGSRIFFVVLANFPRFLHAMEQGSADSKTAQTAESIATVADARGFPKIAAVLDDYLTSKQQSTKEFIFQLFDALKTYFLPALDFDMIKMLMGMLTNNLPWLKIKTMEILSVIIPEVDMRKPEIAGHWLGPNLTSPPPAAERILYGGSGCPRQHHDNVRLLHGQASLADEHDAIYIQSHPQGIRTHAESVRNSGGLGMGNPRPG